MTRTIYIDPDGREYSVLPRTWHGYSPVYWKAMEAEGWTKREEEIPEPQEDTSLRDAAEKAIVQSIYNLAAKYNAIPDLISMTDITIPSLMELAQSKNVSLSDWNNLISEITPMKWQLEALVGGTWAECWDGLKSRFASWIAEIIGG